MLLIIEFLFVLPLLVLTLLPQSVDLLAFVQESLDSLWSDLVIMLHIRQDLGLLFGELVLNARRGVVDFLGQFFHLVFCR